MIMVTVLAFLAEFTRFQLWLVEHRFLKRGVKGYSTFGTVAGYFLASLQPNKQFLGFLLNHYGLLD